MEFLTKDKDRGSGPRIRNKPDDVASAATREKHASENSYILARKSNDISKIEKHPFNIWKVSGKITNFCHKS